MFKRLWCRMFHRWKVYSDSAICENCDRIYANTLHGWVEVEHFGD